uniref:Zinc finger PMZ-type domain-containing protein n=1 Tax=Lactuca sativa TaxID=4236 RepID=A0A9R1WSW2_LACSA|nr:hypothetical protein LSAT_V11C900481720 [Lactuca sativa]
MNELMNGLSKIPLVHWARFHFTGRAHSDCLINNLCEVFNFKLEHGRDKPVITCLEYIRVYLMKRHRIVQKEIDKCKSILAPTTTNILDTIKTSTSKYMSLFCGSGDWYWEITGIVCRHGVCAIREHIQNGEKAQQPEYWVHPFYNLGTWRAMYSNKIDPINGKSMWPKSRCLTTLIPPTHHTRVIGRAKKRRRRVIHKCTNQLTNLSRKFITITCSKCHNKGHNSRTCKGQGGQLRNEWVDQVKVVWFD